MSYQAENLMKEVFWVAKPKYDLQNLIRDTAQNSKPNQK